MSTNNNSEDKKTDNYEKRSQTTRNEEFDPSKINEHVKRLTHKLPSNHQPHKVIAGENGKTETFYKSKLKPKELLFFKNCKDCTFNVETTCTKIMIEDCENLKLSFSAKILTNVLELWKCKNIDIFCDTQVFTIQIDICNDIKLNFNDIDFYHQVVWAGVNNLSIEFPKHSEHNLVTGFKEMCEEFDDLNEEIDQFIVRFVDGKLTSEQVVRLSNGYPTTNREADEYDLRHKKNEDLATEHIKKMVNLTPQIGIHNIAKKGSDGKKIKIRPNDKCPCGSKLKYKKCCGNPTIPNQLAESIRKAKQTGGQTKGKETSTENNTNEQNNNSELTQEVEKVSLEENNLQNGKVDVIEEKQE